MIFISSDHRTVLEQSPSLCEDQRMSSAYWLLKTEPETYSFEQLQKDRKTPWNGVRNFQARNFLKEAKVGDQALIYHSGKDKAVVGIAEVTRTAFPDPDPKKPGDWVQIEIAPLRPFKRAVPLSELKTTPALKTLQLIRQSRLSVSPVSPEHFRLIVKLGDQA